MAVLEDGFIGGVPDHTPGPWTTKGGGGVGIVAKDGYLVATCSMPNRFNIEVQAANARLIAAAPDMLAALEKIAVLCDDPGAGSITHEASRIARKAID